LASGPAPEDRFAARELANSLSGRAQVSIPILQQVPCHRGILLRRTGGIDPLPVPGEHPGPHSREAYSLQVTSDGVTVSARSSAGLYYAVQTLKQLVEGNGAQAVLPVVQITDWPALAYRGVMVDMSHGALPTEKEVERQLDFLARWKTNQYYFYSEDSIALKGFPLINPQGRFTQDQVQAIVLYGRERHIDVIPCLELYGHQHDLFRIEKYSTLSDLPHGTEFDPTNPQVAALLANWVSQFAQLFPSPFVHIGFDETFQIELAAEHGGMAAKPGQLFIHQLNNVDHLFKDHGKTVMAWGDIMVKYPAIVSQLPPGLIAVAWEYNPDPKSHYQHWLGPLAAQHVPHMIASGVTCWNQVMPDYERSFENIDTFLAAGRKSGAIGLMNTLWTDDAQNLMRTAWPGLAYGAAAAWQSTPVDRSDFFSEYSRLMYPSAVSSDVAQALRDLESSELELQRVLGGQTMLALWKDPFAPAILKEAAAHQSDLRQTRLLAEDAEIHLERALSEGGNEVSLQPLLFGSRLLDYAGERFQTAPELEAMWRRLGPRRPKGDLWWDEWGSQVTYQDHSRLVDLMDAITELRPQYRRAWLAEYAPYRLDSALGRWDAEYQYWRALQERLVQFSDNSHAGQLLPPLESLLH
jgi:hexosaminidase